MPSELQEADCIVEEEERFHGLHPLKRFKILEKERVMQNREKEAGVKREEQNLQRNNEVGVKVCSLPAKKRVCALQFFTNLPDEEDEQENRNMFAKARLDHASSVATRALQPIISNRQVPVSIKKEEEKARRGLSSVATRANLPPILNRQVSVGTDSTERASTRQQQKNGVNFAKAATRHVLVTTGESLSGGRQVLLKLEKKQRDQVNSVAFHPQLSVDTERSSQIREREIEVKLARKKKDASLAPTNRQMLISTSDENAICNRQVSVATEGDCENVSVSTGILLLKEQGKETGANCAANMQPIHNCQVLVAPGLTEKGAACKPEERCSADEGEEQSDGEDDGVFCDVCKDADAEPSDPIVFCDGCNVMVHPSCYGNPLIDGIPAGDWFCRQCESENRRKKAGESQKRSHVGFHVGQRTCASRVCCLCPSRTGAMKRTTGGAWAHLSCALYVPEVFYKRARDREGIECGSVPAWRWELPCVVCTTRGQGACIQCTEVGCCSTFHVSCALNAGLTIDFRNANTLTKTPAIVIAFCPSHSRQALTSSERRRFKIVPRT